MDVTLFSWIDYLIFFVMLAIGCIVGIYFGFFGPDQNNKETYLLGDKNMSVLPVALSAAASRISGITLVSLPTEVFRYGTHIWLICVADLVATIISCYMFLPVLVNLELTSLYEYFYVRFNRKVQVFTSFLYTTIIFTYNPLVIYLPSLGFAQVSGINEYYIMPVVTAICIFYTTIGGLKTVIWTDAIQFIGMVISLLVILCLGVNSVGGLKNMWSIAQAGDRLSVEFSFDPTIKNTFWTFVIGASFFQITTFSLNQSCMQKYLAVKNLPNVKKVAFLYCLGAVMMTSLAVLTGITMYSKYADCNPLATNEVHRPDFLLPYFVMDIAGHIPGIPGIFVAGIFSASLSTLSATLNTTSATIYEDFIKPFMSESVSKRKTGFILKLIVIISGILSTLLVLLFEKIDGIISAFVVLQNICTGSTLGLFILGLFFPNVNGNSALMGALTGFVFALWFSINQLWYTGEGIIKEPMKPFSTEGCTVEVNVPTNVTVRDENVLFYNISMWYTTLMSLVVVIVVALLATLVTKKSPPPKKELISQWVHFTLPKEVKDMS